MGSFRQVERDLAGLKCGIDRLGSFARFGDLNMRHTHNTLSENIRAKSIELLNKHVAVAIDLHGQVKHAHWNVRGPAFIAIHELFDEIADEVEDYSDALAKRSAAVGGTAQRTVEVAAKCSFLVPYDLGITDEKEHIFTFLGALATRPLSRSGMIDRSGTSFRAGAADGHSRAVRGPRSYRCPRSKPGIPATTMSPK